MDIHVWNLTVDFLIDFCDFVLNGVFETGIEQWSSIVDDIICDNGYKSLLHRSSQLNSNTSFIDLDPLSMDLNLTIVVM